MAKELYSGFVGTVVVKEVGNSWPFETSGNRSKMFCHPIKLLVQDDEYIGNYCTKENAVPFLPDDQIHIRVREKNAKGDAYKIDVIEHYPLGTAPEIKDPEPTTEKRTPVKLVSNTLKEAALRHAVYHYSNRINCGAEDVIATARLFEAYLSE